MSQNDCIKSKIKIQSYSIFYAQQIWKWYCFKLIQLLRKRFCLLVILFSQKGSGKKVLTPLFSIPLNTSPCKDKMFYELATRKCECLSSSAVLIFVDGPLVNLAQVAVTMWLRLWLWQHHPGCEPIVSTSEKDTFNPQHIPKNKAGQILIQHNYCIVTTATPNRLLVVLTDCVLHMLSSLSTLPILCTALCLLFWSPSVHTSWIVTCLSHRSLFSLSLSVESSNTWWLVRVQE